jgi:Ca-activated chloride channel family protein
MVALERLSAFARDILAQWEAIRFGELFYVRRDVTILMLVALVGLSLATLIARSALGRRPGRHSVALPAILDWNRATPLSFVRHGAFLLFLAGLPFFVIALTDPYTALMQQEVTFPGRRIAVMIDASSSMLQNFPTETLGRKSSKGSPPPAVFMTTVSAAETFVRQRVSGKYHDLIGLVEFGDEAYVVTPFTNDYDNILLSLSLIGDWTEFVRFPDQGTTIGKAIEQGVGLFRAFDYLNASGNLLLLFSDGQDDQVTINGTPVSAILADARRARIPLYMVRVGYKKTLGSVVPDSIWKPAVEATGGKFYAASDEAAILQAVREIDRLSAGTIAIRQYTTQQPRFPIFALLASGLWTLAIGLKLTVPYFQTFP